LVKRIEIFAIAFPVPGHSSFEAFERHRFDFDQHACDVIAVLWLAGGKAKATVGHEHTGKPMPATGRGEWVPKQLCVVVGVDIDETRSNDQMTSVNYFLGWTFDLSHGSNLAPTDRKVAVISRHPRAIDKKPILNQ
jgi:hypothetical protein